MARLVLHIGTHKTGTTAIQDSFAQNAARLKRHGLIYPKLSRHAGHHGLASDWAALPNIYDLPGGSREALRRLAADHAQGDHTVLISSEEFSRGAATGQTDFVELREIVSAFERVEVICVLREQWQFLQSIFLEVAKVGPPPTPASLVDSALRTGLAEGLWLDYNRLYTHLRKAFTPGEITLLDFDCARAHPDGLIGALLTALGLPDIAAELKPSNGGVANVSPPSLPAWSASMIAAPSLPPHWLTEATTEAFRIEFGTEAKPCLFTRDEIGRLVTHFAPLNARLAKRVRKTIPPFGISQSDPRSRPEMIFREAISASYWLRCSRWVFATKR